jgi:lipopolysaccharide export system permease protein
MRLIQRYLFRQMLVPTVLATIALGAVALLSQTLGALEILVDNRQTAGVFAKVILLTLPHMLALVLPVALFVAALVALNRLHTEQEIVVCFAGGMSRHEVGAPALRLAALAALATLLVNLWVQPAAYRTMREELYRIRTDLAASLVREGEFTQPAPGLTVYAQKVDAEGELINLFINEERPNKTSSTFAARSGRTGYLAGRPVLIMKDGANQAYDSKGVLTHLAFDEYVFDLAPYVNTQARLHYKISDRYLHELVFPDLTQDWERQNAKKMLAEAHYRLASPLYDLTFVALALVAVIGGSFSRMGYGRRIVAASAAAIVIRVLGVGMQAAADATPALNLCQYLAPLGPFAVCMWLLSRRDGTRRLGGRSLAPAGA